MTAPKDCGRCDELFQIIAAGGEALGRARVERDEARTQLADARPVVAAARAIVADWREDPVVTGISNEAAALTAAVIAYERSNSDV